MDTSLWTIFTTGLLTGGLTCLAVQGGLLASTIAQREQDNLIKKFPQDAFPIFAFLTTKLIAYTILGFLLGWFGTLFQLSLTAQIIMQTVVTFFMIGTAFNILNIHPIFRYFVLQPPKFLTRLVRNQSKSKSIFAPAILGAFTVFIPCGTTQAMMALAIASANPFYGAAILAAFILGTSPLFFILGYFATKLTENMHQRVMYAAATTLLILAIFNLHNILALTGLPLFNSTPSISQTETKSDASVISSSAENATITIKSSGYAPNILNVKAGSQVTLKIENKGAYTCASAFTIPYFSIQKMINPGKSETVTLQMPSAPTKIPFMCSMGMYRGVINVI